MSPRPAAVHVPARGLQARLDVAAHEMRAANHAALGARPAAAAVSQRLGALYALLTATHQQTDMTRATLLRIRPGHVTTDHDVPPVADIDGAALELGVALDALTTAAAAVNRAWRNVAHLTDQEPPR